MSDAPRRPGHFLPIFLVLGFVEYMFSESLLMMGLTQIGTYDAFPTAELDISHAVL